MFQMKKRVAYRVAKNLNQYYVEPIFIREVIERVTMKAAEEIIHVLANIWLEKYKEKFSS